MSLCSQQVMDVGMLGPVHDDAARSSVARRHVRVDPQEHEIRAAIAGGRHDQAFALIRAAYEPRLYAFAHRMVRDTSLAEDVMQEALLQLHRGLGSLRDGTSVRAWVTAVVVHQALDEIRKRNRRAGRLVSFDDGVDGEHADPQAGAEDVLAQADDVRMLERCLDRLPFKIRAAVLLRFGQEMTFEEVAASLGERPDAVRMRVGRALVRLRHQLVRMGAR